jgi:hypothetical protein
MRPSTKLFRVSPVGKLHARHSSVLDPFALPILMHMLGPSDDGDAPEGRGSDKSRPIAGIIPKDRRNPDYLVTRICAGEGGVRRDEISALDRIADLVAQNQEGITVIEKKPVNWLLTINPCRTTPEVVYQMSYQFYDDATSHLQYHLREWPNYGFYELYPTSIVLHALSRDWKKRENKGYAVKVKLSDNPKFDENHVFYDENKAEEYRNFLGKFHPRVEFHWLD